MSRCNFTSQLSTFPTDSLTVHFESSKMTLRRWTAGVLLGITAARGTERANSGHPATSGQGGNQNEHVRYYAQMLLRCFQFRPVIRRLLANDSSML